MEWRAVHQPRSRRYKTFLPAEVTLPETTVRAHLLNISTSGTCVHTRAAPRVGDVAQVQLFGQVHSARVVWSHLGKSGLSFDAALTSEQISEALELPDT